MKKTLLYIALIIVLCISILYWSLSSTNKIFQKSELVNIDNVDDINFKKYDSVWVAASTLYEADVIKKAMQGEHYREAWATAIKAPVLFLDTLFGGVEIIKEGGGRQTHSLKLKAPNGTLYTLRSINKDPEDLIPEFATTLGLENIVVDGISAQHPYGAIYAAQLSKSAHILHTNPKIVFLPKQKKLKSYNDKYGNRLFLLEYETEGPVNWTSLKNIIELIDTKNLQRLKLEYKNRLQINKKELIKVRLFDFLIGDWDRHTKQWGWAIQKQDTNFVAIPVAGDRDNAFFNTQGIIPSLLSNEHVVPELRPFKEEIDFIEGLVYPFDRYFLLNTSETLFVSEAQALQALISDAVIDNALSVWPKPISAIDGKEITTKIKHRRDDLVKYAKAFKKEIDMQGAVTADLKGSGKLDLDPEFIRCFECY
ncbi:MAG: hypothetical protein WBA19_04045 [Psychroserpens sp.]